MTVALEFFKKAQRAKGREEGRREGREEGRREILEAIQKAYPDIDISTIYPHNGGQD